MTTRQIKLAIAAAFTVIPLAVLLIFWPQWMHVPWWQTLIMLSVIQGAALNGAEFTRILLRTDRLTVS